jgi:hypothetical protein
MLYPGLILTFGMTKQRKLFRFSAIQIYKAADTAELFNHWPLDQADRRKNA